MICRSLPRMKKVVRISSRPPSALAPSTATPRSGASSPSIFRHSLSSTA